jgi:SPOR domain
MLGELVNWLTQALVRFLRWPSRQKPSLMVAIGSRRKANALAEYQRRFAPSAGEGYELPYLPVTGDQDVRKPPPEPDRDRAKQRQSFETGKVGLRFEAGGSHREDAPLKAKARWSGGSGDFFGAVWALLNLTFLRCYHGVAGRRLRWNGLAAVIAGCTIALGGAYLYRMMKPGGDDSIRIDRAAQSLDGNTEKAESRPSGKKLTYARLTPDGPVAAPPAVHSVQAGPPKPPSAGSDNRTDGAVPEGKEPANAAASSQAAAAQGQTANKRTMVRGETYLPDGTRIDAARPAPIPSIVRLGAAKPRPPFLAAAQPPEAAAVPAAEEARSAPAAVQMKANSTPTAALAQAAEPPPSLEAGYFAQVKADQDQKAAEAELAAIVEKYKDVLGDVPLKTRSVDLKEKGVWIRVLAGPLKSWDEAAGLCNKLKRAGAEACFVQKFD